MQPEPMPVEFPGDITLFRRTVERFVREDLMPVQEQWRADGRPDELAWARAGAAGLLLLDLPVEYGGGGGTFEHEAVFIEELAKAGVNLATFVQDSVAHYVHQYGRNDQKERLLPAMARGSLVGAVALTEPSAGSDLQAIRTVARREGDSFIINGSKTFVTNGWHAGLLCLAVRTNPGASGPRGISILLVETNGLSGYRVGNPLRKIGMHGQDSCELFFDEVRVPAACLLGDREGLGIAQIMDRMDYERLAISAVSVATMEAAVHLTAEYVKRRVAFGKTLMDQQNTRMMLAECATKATIGRILMDECIKRFVAGRLDSVGVAQAKVWLTESEGEVLDACLQLHGGYGYMAEYQIGRMWTDARVRRIYAGANEVLKEMVAWSL